MFQHFPYEELHKSYDTDGKAVVDLSDEDYEPPKKEELVEHEEHEGEYPSGLPQLPMLPPWMFQHFPFGFPHGFPFFPPPPAHPGHTGPHPRPHYPLPPSPPRYMSKMMLLTSVSVAAPLNSSRRSLSRTTTSGGMMWTAARRTRSPRSS